MIGESLAIRGAALLYSVQDMKINNLTIGRGPRPVQAIRRSKTAGGVHPTDMRSVQAQGRLRSDE
jgi:hypothetical protein